jgi:hypothetical protein
MNDRFIEYINDLLSKDVNSLMPDLTRIIDSNQVTEALCALRLSLQRPAISALTCMQLGNFWDKLDRVALKPNPTNTKLYFLSDATAETYERFLIPFAGSY